MFNHLCDGANTSTSTVQSYATAGVSLLLCVVTVPGNLLVCVAVLKSSNKNIRNPFNYFVLSLAIADLVVGCVTEPLAVYVHVKEATGRPSNIVEVKCLHLSYFISCTTSVLSICLLGIERYMAITSPLKFRLFFSFKRFLTLATIVWIVSIGLSSIYIFTTYSIYAFVFITNAVGWTLGVSVFTYVKILRKFKERMRNTTLSSARSSTSQNPLPPNPWNVQLTKTYMIIISIFLACYIPACVVIYTMNWCKTCSCLTLYYFQDLQFIIVALNSALNPFVYAFRFKRFRHAVLQILQCGKSARQRSAMFQSTTTLSKSTRSLQFSRESVSNKRS